MDCCPLYLTWPCVIIMMTLTANQSVKKKRCLKIWSLQIHPPTTFPLLSCQLRLLCKTQGPDEWTHPVSQSNLTTTEFWMSETNLQPSITWKKEKKKWGGRWLDTSCARVKIVCSPNSLEALKKRGLNAQLCALVCPWIDLHYQNK